MNTNVQMIYLKSPGTYITQKLNTGLMTVTMVVIRRELKNMIDIEEMCVHIFKPRSTPKSKI